jgi:hypothetical protein
MKRCFRCGVEKGLEEFYDNRYGRKRDGKQSQCKACTKQQAVAWQASHPEVKRRNNRQSALKRIYGITSEQYDTLLAEQGGRCKLCGTSQPGGAGRFHIDHNHDSGLIRGLLCQQCNMGLGLFGDDTQRLTRAVKYLEMARLIDRCGGGLRVAA